MKRHNIEFKLARTDETKDGVAKLVYEVFCMEQRYLKKEKYPSKRVYDKYDLVDTTYNFLAIYDNKAVGTARFIGKNILGFPIEEIYDLSNLNKDRKKSAEIGRLIVLKKMRKSYVALNLLKILYVFGKQKGIKNFFFMSSIGSQKMYEKFGGRVFDKKKYNPHVNRPVVPMIWKLSETKEPYNTIFNKPDKRIIF